MVQTAEQISQVLRVTLPVLVVSPHSAAVWEAVRVPIQPDKVSAAYSRTVQLHLLPAVTEVAVAVAVEEAAAPEEPVEMALVQQRVPQVPVLQ